MSIRDSDVQRVREATDIVALIGRRVSLKRVGSRHVGLCPFHTEKTPSFSVNGAEGFYHCFGCKASGDAITFLRETEHLDFSEAVEQLAAAANITLTYESAGAQRANQRRKELMDLLEAAARFYHERLMSSPDAGEARAYLRRRGYDRDTVVRWRLGYAPPQWDALCRHLGAPAAQLAAAGLAYAESRRSGSSSAARDPQSEHADEAGTADGADQATEAAQASDFFRDRVMFPICDASGRVVSFAGRLLPRPGEPPPKGPKYKNTAGTAVYDKSKVLYGLHLAKQAARTAERIVVCEGYTDVIGCELAGVAEAVATCGTALTRQHAELLSRSATRIVLAFDADAAGQTATERVHQWERALGLDIFVAPLPPGSDPGDLAASDPPALRRAISEAQPLHAFRAERILDRADLDSPSGRDRAADEAAEVFAVYPAEVVLDRDLEPIAARIPMDVGSFRERVDAVRQQAAERADAAAGPPDRYDDAPPPPDPGDGYDDAFDAGFADDGSGYEGDPYRLDADGSYGAAGGASGMSRRRRGFSGPPPTASQRRPARADSDLLAAAAAPHGDALGLLVPELFATSAGHEAFDRMAADATWREQIAAAADESAGHDGDPVSEMLGAAAAEGALLSAEEANDRIATAMLHFVRSLIASISGGGDVPRVRLDPGLSASAQLQYRHQCLRWLRERQPELQDLNQRIAAVRSVCDWLQSLGEPESPTRQAAAPEAGEPEPAATA